MDETELLAYRAARERVAFADISDWGWIRLTGRDRLDLLHRLSTNDLKKLKPGEGAPTVFASAIGRVMALVTVYVGQEDVFVRTMPGQNAGVTRYLNSMIFWQDQAEVVDLTVGACQFGLYGPDAGTGLQQMLDEKITDLQPYGWTMADLYGAHVSLHRGGPLEAFDWFLDVPPSGRETVREALAALGPELGDAALDVLRIEAGLPWWGRELSEQVTPLETGLLPAISFNKGCYTGQEVIARQTNYDKVTRNLVGLEVDVAPDAPLLSAEGSEGEIARIPGPGRGGFVSSIAYSPSLGKVIALAVVPRELTEPGRTVEVVAGAHTVQATVRSLPFIPKS